MGVSYGEQSPAQLSYRVNYRFGLGDGSERSLVLWLNPSTMEQTVDVQPAVPPRWTALGFKQCAHCPLDSLSHHQCPLAACLSEVVDICKDLASYDLIRLVVESPDREVRAETSAQRAISSLLGLVIATSPCPHTRYLRPMARFHLPLATEEETVYRAASMYLLAQYFVHRDGESPDLDLDGLRNMYKQMQVVNFAIAERLRAVDGKDGTVNAVILLDLFTRILPDAIEDALGNIRHLFAPYLDGSAGFLGRSA